MSAPTNHWKLGLFVLLSGITGLCVLIFVTARALQHETLHYTSYFDEAVGGLEMGAAVSFRGVKLGRVSAVKVAPDGRHVEVAYDLERAELERLGLGSGHGTARKIRVPKGLRVQLASNGITGVKYLQIDFFPADAAHLPPDLPFPVPQNYIPSTRSTLKNLEDAVVRAADAVPALAQGTGQIVEHITGLLEEMRDERLPQKASLTFQSAASAFRTLDEKLQQLEVDRLSGDTHEALAKLRDTLDKLDGLLARVDGEQGLMTSVQRASNNIGDVAANMRGLELGSALGDMREAARALRELAVDLQNDPDMLVKGRARVAP